MKPRYRRWFEQRKYEAGTINAQLYGAARVEEFHGDLDAHFARDRMASLIDVLRYSTDDSRHNRPNPSKIPFDGDIRTNFASCRIAVERYRALRDAGSDRTLNGGDAAGRQFALERGLQTALRTGIHNSKPA